MNRRYTIGYYDDSAVFGGTTRYLLEILDSLDRDAFQPVFFAVQRLPWHDALVAKGVEMVVLKDEATAAGPIAAPVEAPQEAKRRRIPESAAWWLGLGRDLRQLIRLFKKRPIDLLHSDNAGAEPAPFAARLAGVPRILATWHVDSTYDMGERSSFRYRFLERRCMHSLDHAIALTTNSKIDWMERTGLGASFESHVSLIRLSVHLNRLERRRSLPEAKAALGIPAESLVIGSLGRLHPHKGYEYLIRALPAILREVPETRVVIGGNGPLEGELRALAAELGVAQAVHFTGFLKEIRDVLEPADIYIQPSLCEVGATAVLEAAGMRIPVTGSTAGGIPEVIALVTNNESGLLFPPRNPELLASTMVKLLHDSTLRARLGEVARENVARWFNPAKMVSETEAVYRQMLSEKS